MFLMIYSNPKTNAKMNYEHSTITIEAYGIILSDKFPNKKQVKNFITYIICQSGKYSIMIRIE